MLTSHVRNPIDGNHQTKLPAEENNPSFFTEKQFTNFVNSGCEARTLIELLREKNPFCLRLDPERGFGAYFDVYMRRALKKQVIGARHFLEAADRVGELRHRRRLRNLERLREQEQPQATQYAMCG